MERDVSWTVDNKRIALGAPIRSGNADCVCIGTAGGKRYLVTLSTQHSENYEAIHRRMRLDIPGIAPLVYVGKTDDGCPFADALVEEIIGSEAKPTLDVRELGAAVAKVVAAVHAAKGVLAGIRPELIYVENNAFAALLPRGPQFAASAPMTRGVRTYAMPYMSPEAFTNSEVSAAGDVFELAESLWFLATGAHPFGSDTMEVVQNLMANKRAAWTGDEKLGAKLTACLVPSPNERPSADELSRLLLA